MTWRCFPKKGRLSKADKDREQDPEFINFRRKHSSVESAINALEVHGLDKCPDDGINGFKKYIAIAVLARNIHRLGAIIQNKLNKKINDDKKRKQPEKYLNFQWQCQSCCRVVP